MNPLAGLGLGLALGFAMAGSVYQANARRQREVLARLVTQGRFRLLESSGQAVEPQALFAALDAALGLAVTPEQRARRKWLIWGTLALCVVVGFVSAVVAARLHR